MTDAAITQTQTIEVDGLRIRYADSGAAGGPVILFTSPWPESLFAFRRVWPALAPTGRLVAVDLPGFGHSQGRPDVLTPSAMGEFLYQFIGALGLGAPHLVAPDVGTSAALFLAARHPDAVRSMVIGGGGSAVPLDVTGTLADPKMTREVLPVVNKALEQVQSGVQAADRSGIYSQPSGGPVGAGSMPAR